MSTAVTIENAKELQQTGRFAEAELILAQILGEDPQHAEATRVLGVISMQTGYTDRGLALIQRAAILAPHKAVFHNSHGAALSQLERHEEAVPCFDKALRLNPDHAGAVTNRGMTLWRLGRYERAVPDLQHALQLQPHHPAVLAALADSYRAIGRLADAAHAYDMLLNMQPNEPEAPIVLALLRLQLAQPQEALAVLERFHSCHTHPSFHGTYAGALANCDRHEEALSHFDQAFALDAKPVFMLGKGHSLLSLGRYAEAWPAHEAGRAVDLQAAVAPSHGLLWSGREDVQGKVVYLFHEQGLGDTIQFFRYAAKVRALGAKVVAAVQAPLLTLLKDVYPGVTVVPSGFAVASDYYASYMSLPAIFQTDVSTIPSPSTYIWAPTAAAKACATWADRLGRRRRPRIGIAWSGSADNGDDAARSTRLSAWLPLLTSSTIHADWYVMQLGMRDADRATLDQVDNLTDFGDQLGDFACTAGLMVHMDLVITVDTSIAHLAGALGVPTWVLLSYAPDWRWMQHRNDSPWYLSATLFRQPALGDWASVIDTVHAALQRKIQEAP